MMNFPVLAKSGISTKLLIVRSDEIRRKLELENFKVTRLSPPRRQKVALVLVVLLVVAAHEGAAHPVRGHSLAHPTIRVLGVLAVSLLLSPSCV